jgi:hypothetical protein
MKKFALRVKQQILYIRPPLGRRYGLKRLCVQSSTIGWQPPNFNLSARLQTHLIRCVTGFNYKVVIASHSQTGTKNIAHVNKFKHFRGQRMRTGL